MTLSEIRALICKDKCSKCGNYQRKKGTCYEPCQYPDSRMTELEDVALKLLAVAEAAKENQHMHHGSANCATCKALAALEADT